MTTSRGQAGFTLIELLTVIAILALIAGFAIPAVERTIDEAMLQSDARALMVELRRVQSDAVAHQEDISVVNAKDAGLQLSSGDSFVPPSGSSLGLAEGTNRIDFFSDGTSTGGRLVVTRGSDSAQIEVSWLSGDVREEADQ